MGTVGSIRATPPARVRSLLLICWDATLSHDNNTDDARKAGALSPECN